MKSNPKASFRYTKSKLNFKNAIPGLVDNGKIISDNNGKAKAFNYDVQECVYKRIRLSSRF